MFLRRKVALVHKREMGEREREQWTHPITCSEVSGSFGTKSAQHRRSSGGCAGNSGGKQRRLGV